MRPIDRPQRPPRPKAHCAMRKPRHAGSRVTVRWAERASRPEAVGNNRVLLLTRHKPCGGGPLCSAAAVRGAGLKMSTACPWREPYRTSESPKREPSAAASALVLDLEFLDLLGLGLGRLDPFAHLGHGHDQFG